MGSTWRTLFFMFFLLGCTGNSVEEQAKRLGLLGAPTGYYDYDENLAYAVRSTAMDGPHGKAYLLVFVTDKHTGTVSRAMFVPEIGPRKAG